MVTNFSCYTLAILFMKQNFGYRATKLKDSFQNLLVPSLFPQFQAKIQIVETNC